MNPPRREAVSADPPPRNAKPTRRDFALMAGAAAMIPDAVRAQASAALVIAEGGASIERPWGTTPAYELAVRQGADFIAADLVASQDGALLARPDNDISASTDVAARSQFAARRVSRIVDGRSVSGWFTEDFTLAELKSLTCRGLASKSRGASAAFDGKWPILTFQEVIDLARAASVRAGRVIGVCATLRRPSYFASLGLQLEPRLADAIRVNGYDWPAAAMLARSFEVGSLKTLGALSRVRRVQMVRADGGPPDQPGARYADMIGADGLKAMRGWADAIAADPPLLLDLSGSKPAASGLAGRARAVGLGVQGTLDGEADILPPAPFRPGDRQGFLMALFASGIDALSCPTPSLAARARNAWLDESRRRATRPG